MKHFGLYFRLNSIGDMMTHRVVLFCIMLSCATLSSSQVFKPNCKVSFQNIAEEQPIDNICGITGNKGSTAALQLQSKAKNNFCAPGPAAPLNFQDLIKLQQAADKDGRRSLQPPAERAAFQKLGEGRLVQVVAFSGGAHYSDVMHGESVNCNLPGVENNDIHLNLLQNPGDELCNSITAEISPHLRPHQWEQLVDMPLGVPLRITGQLFFDSTHRPCENGHESNPRRASTWEIHPVYSIEICTHSSIGECRIDDAKVWTPLATWVNPAASPSKLGIAILPAVPHAKENITIQVSLLSARNEPAAWKQETPVFVTIDSKTSGFHATRNITIPANNNSGTLSIYVPNPGVYIVSVESPQLRSFSMFFNVLHSASRMLFDLHPRLLEVSFKSTGSRNVSAVTLMTPASSQQKVRLEASPSRDLMANGFDQGYVAVLLDGDTAHEDIKIHLHTSLGFFNCPVDSGPERRPECDIVIPRSYPNAMVTITSSQMGQADITAVSNSPNINLVKSTVSLHFAPPITKIIVEASPPEVSLAEMSSVTVRLADEKGVSYTPLHPQKVFLSIRKGSGHLTSKDNSITITPPDPAGSASFVPGFKIGETELLATTNELPDANISLTVTTPVWLLLISVVGGLAGGSIYVFTNKSAGVIRIVIGAFTGFLLYWGVVFGVLSITGPAAVVNPISDFAISVIGGWIGTQVFSLLMRQLGFSK
jgi:hypothetical protein